MTNRLLKKIAVLPGDGIGVEVTQEAIKIFSALGLPIELQFGDIGWEFWKSEGNPIPQRTWDLIERSDLTLLGAITSMPRREAQNALPAYLKEQEHEYVSPIIQLRQHLELYANLRPCFNVKGGVAEFNFAIIRENTEGLYAGFDYHPVPEELYPLLRANHKWCQQDFSKVSASLRLQSEAGLLRLYRFAFAHAHANQFERVTLADKPNVLRQSSAFARECFEYVAQDYPHIKADILNVDAVALWLVRRPEEFGVIVAENMFGDILSDLSAGVMGGLGFSPSANIGEKGAYFEPVHGSAPRVSPGKANPAAMFLTCAMLLRHLGYQNEAVRIQQAVTQVVKTGKYLTYDLGGRATTAEMASSIIEATLKPQQQKTIAFLATGSELLHGELLESNSHHSSDLINQAGGTVRAKIILGDNQQGIAAQLLNLLDTNDAVITIGGLGPTSDDCTRFSVSDVTRLPLELNENSWEHVQARLNRFGLKVTESNKQQALFPQHAEILENEFGTANACHLQWRGRDIFMLPGPPKEYFPLFEKKVMPYLEQAHYFSSKKMYRYVTLGLIEGEISDEVDVIAQKHQLATAYRWHYPYLEIKILVEGQVDASPALEEIDALLNSSIVSTDGSNAKEILAQTACAVTHHIWVKTAKETQEILNEFNLGLIHIDMEESIQEEAATVYFELSWPKPEDSNQVLGLSFVGKHQSTVIYQHQLQTPKRETGIEQYIQSYFAWQLNQFMHLLAKDS